MDKCAFESIASECLHLYKLFALLCKPSLIEVHSLNYANYMMQFEWITVSIGVIKGLQGK